MATKNGRGVAQNLPGEEDLRFIRNFHDIFLSLGIAMFAAGLGVATAILVGPMFEKVANTDGAGWRGALSIAGLAALADAVVMWLLAEFFARGRRLFLPSIVIFLAFNLFIFIAAGAGYGVVMGADKQFFEELDRGGDDGVFGVIQHGAKFFMIVFGIVTAAIFAFYARMKLPFAMATGAYSFASVGVAAAFFAAPEKAQALVLPAQLGAGIFMFLLGVIYDARDPERQTRISDNGFWLHLFAAPLILNSVLAMTIGADHTLGAGSLLVENTAGAAVTTLIVVFAFAFVSLLINRRALLVAGLLYALVAFGFLISKVGLSGAWTLAVTLLVMGGGMVLLGSGWHTLRRIIVAPFPKSGLIARIIPPEPPKGETGRVSE